MRTPLCSTPLTPEGLWRLRQAVHAAGERLALTPLQRARWLTAASTAGRAVMEAGGRGSLTLLLDTDSRCCGGPALVARLPLPFAMDAAAADDWQAASPALAAVRGLVDHLGLEAADQGAALLSLEIAVAADLEAGGSEAAEPEPAGTPTPQPPPELLDLVARQDDDMAALLGALQAELAATRGAQADTLNTLAHDIRSPLLTLNLSLEMLRIKPHGPAELQDRCEVMKRQLDELKALAARARQGALSLSPPPAAQGELPPL